MPLGDSGLKGRAERSSSLRDLIDTANAVREPTRQEPEQAASGEFDPLPKPGDPYKAHSRPGNKPETTLHAIGKNACSRGFAWGSYDGIDLVPSDKPGQGPLLVMRFASIVPMQIVIEGRNLGLLHAYLGQGRISWIREIGAAAEFRQDGETVISRITIRRITGFSDFEGVNASGASDAACGG